MTAPGNILIIEDDAAIQRTLRLLLEDQGYGVTTASSARIGLSLAKSNRPDLVLLDLGLPDCDGIELLEQGELQGIAPVIVTTARCQDADKVKALDAGAEDYVVKPFSIAELYARIRAVLRRHKAAGQAAPPAEQTVGPLSINTELRCVTLEGNELHLTPNEYKLLLVLLENQGKAETGNAQIDQCIGQVPEGGDQQADEDQGHGQRGAQVGCGDDGGADADGGVVLGVLHGVPRFMAGNADGGGGGAAVDVIGEADDVGSGVVMVCQIAADAFDPHTGDTVGREYLGCGLGSGEPPAGILLGIALEGAVHIGAGPQRENHAGQDQDDIGPVKAVIIRHKTTPYQIFFLFYPKRSWMARPFPGSGAKNL